MQIYEREVNLPGSEGQERAEGNAQHWNRGREREEDGEVTDNTETAVSVQAIDESTNAQ